MKTMKYDSHPHPALQQLHQNACLWVGHMNTGATDHLAGQTFQCPDDGVLDNIQVYSIAVAHPGRVILTIHPFDRETKSWGPPLSTSEIEVSADHADNWIHFPLPSVELQKDNIYGFRLKSPDTLVAIAEAAWPSKSPFAWGEEWNSNSKSSEDHYYRYFSLAFKVELRA